MSEVTLNINGQKVTAQEGTTILEAARSVGIEIPTLCSHEKLIPYGACRLCMVEIEKNGKKRMVTSCVYLVEDGLNVDTESDDVVWIRSMLLEVLLAFCPGVKPIQDYAKMYRINKTRYDIESDFCILCGTCVRYCREVKGKNAIGFVGRGTSRKVMFFPDIALDECPKCGECFPLCPTGVIPSNYAMTKLPHFSYGNVK
jgi:bidirectional [NiFe] hydrogenase diaphorase subunit